MTVIENSDALKKMWSNYQKQFAYAKDIGFDDVCDQIKSILSSIKQH